jgi:hypothetical protein
MLFDDAFIHLRTSQNLALHRTAFFNLGERVMSTSSPLWTVTLALTGIATHIWLLPFFEAALLTACGILAFHLSRKVLPETSEAVGISSSKTQRTRVQSILLAGIAGILTILLVLPSSLGQMETPFAMMLLLAAACSLAQVGSLALPLLALAACTRLEMLPLLLVACVVAAARKSHRLSLTVAVGIVVAMAGAVYAQFGVLLPNSMRAKAIGYAYERTDILEQIFEARFLKEPLAWCLVIFLGSMVVDQFLALQQRRIPRSMWVPALAGIWGAFAMLEYVVRDTPIFEWYRPLLWLPLLVCFLLYRSAPSSWPWLRRTLELARFVGIPLLILIPLWKGISMVKAAVQDTPIARSAADRGDSARVQEYLVVGRALRATCPRGTLMTAEIGALGWAFGGYVSDAFGIASPSALAFQPLRSGAPVAGIPAGFVAQIRPDMVVSYTVLDVEVRENPALMRKYELVELPASLLAVGRGMSQRGWHGSTHLDVMLRKDGMCPVAEVESVLRAALQ